MTPTTPSKKTQSFSIDTLPDEYRFDYSKAKPNHFAQAFEQQQIMVASNQDIKAKATTIIS